MALTEKIEWGLIITVSLLFCILLFNLTRKFLSVLPIRVNCWFCNGYTWVKVPVRNNWTCPHCEQYNGFSKDGDYNRPLINNNDTNCRYTYNASHPSSPPQNGLCKMCNVNQQLKVMQLSNFVPMNENNYDFEIDNYRLHLEKAYKLCSTCKKVLQMKLHKEKETLLSSKVIESKTPEKKSYKKESKVVKNVLKNLLKLTAILLLILISVDLCRAGTKHKKISKTFKNIKEILTQSTKAMYNNLKMKLLQFFPELETYQNGMLVNLELFNNNFINFMTNNNISYDNVSKLTQESLSGFACLIQIVGHILKVNKIKHAVIVDLLLTVLVMSTVTLKYIELNEVAVNLIKVTCVLGVLAVIRSSKDKPRAIITKLKTPPTHRMKNLTSKSFNSVSDDGDSSNITDDDVSLTKYGLHNCSGSSNETKTMLNSTIKSGRAFAPCNREPHLNPSIFKSSSSVKSPLDNSFAKPTYWKYQKTTEDSDSDLDESISSLYIGSPKKCKDKSNSIFSLKKFTASPKFVAPSVAPSGRPLISPSKLGLATSWVAGGYWGSESERQLFNLEGSRSSSQSSGFESQASSNQRIFSRPPSRGGSVCGDDRSDAFSNFGSVSYARSYAGCRVNSPVYPQMQFNNHVLIPQPRHATKNCNPFATREKRSIFKTPSEFGMNKQSQGRHTFFN